MRSIALCPASEGVKRSCRVEFGYWALRPSEGALANFCELAPTCHCPGRISATPFRKNSVKNGVKSRGVTVGPRERPAMR